MIVQAFNPSPKKAEEFCEFNASLAYYKISKIKPKAGCGSTHL